MLLIVLEAFGAMLILVLIVWWTMFSGRNKGELHDNNAGETRWTGAEGIPPVAPTSTISPTISSTLPQPLKKIESGHKSKL